MLITRMSKADKKTRRGRSPSICRTQWPAGIEMRHWHILGDSTEILKGIFEKQEQFSKRIVFAKLIDNQSPLYLTKFQSQYQGCNTLVPQWYHRLFNHTKVVDLNLCDGMLYFLTLSACWWQYFWLFVKTWYLHDPKTLVWRVLLEIFWLLRGIDVRTLKIWIRHDYHLATLYNLTQFLCPWRVNLS